MSSTRIRPPGQSARRREPSMRAAARENYRAAANADPQMRRIADVPPQTAEPPLPLTERVRALYEDSVVPVREIAQLAGITERTLYKYVQKGGWRRRHICIARGAGGRFIPLADADKPHASGIGALDPQAAEQATARCLRAHAISEKAMMEAAAVAQARADRVQERTEHAQALALEAQAAREAEERIRNYERLGGVLCEVIRWLVERGDQPVTRSDQFAARLADVTMRQMGAFLAPSSAHQPCIPPG